MIGGLVAAAVAVVGGVAALIYRWSGEDYDGEGGDFS